MSKRNLVTVFLFCLLATLLTFSPLRSQAGQNSAAAAVAGKKAFLPVIFRPQAAASTYTFISWADTKSGVATLTALSQQAKKLNPDLTLYLGDAETAGFTRSGMTRFLTALNGGGSNHISGSTFMLRGNHDTSNTAGWQAYFNSAGVAGQVGAKQFSALDQNLTYSFVFGNAYFAAVDVPGDADRITDRQIAFLDSGLTAAEKARLTHAFLFFHGPIYPVSTHTDCPRRACPLPAPVANLVKMLNRHPIVSAVFHGHEHLMSYTHLDATRASEITHPFEEFITGSAGAELYPCSKTYRFSFCGSYAGFARVSVSGPSFAVSIYRQGASSPVKTYSFKK